jgi:dienelactone hydrolase
MHTNGGIGHQHMRRHAQALLERGYVVLLPDSFESRGARPGSVLPAQVVKDAYDALSHLQGQPFVDKARVYQAGYSLGAYASAMLASPKSAEAFKSPHRFRATVGHYGSCLHQDRPDSPALELLSEDSDRPVLMLMGDRDIETPPKHCFPRLENMKAAGKPVYWHVYPGVTHGWDKREQSGYVYRNASGESMAYAYDEAATADALRRMLAFFEANR